MKSDDDLKQKMEGSPGGIQVGRDIIFGAPSKSPRPKKKWYYNPWILVLVPVFLAPVAPSLCKRFIKKEEKVMSEKEKQINNNQYMNNSPGGIQAGRDLTITQVPKPELKTVNETSSGNADGTHHLTRTVEMNAPYSGKLTITVKADDLLEATIGEGPRQTKLPDGNILTITGGGMIRNEIKVKDFYSATVPTPSGQYIITAITKKKTPVAIDTEFQ